jgi:hypothetical protein
MASAASSQKPTTSSPLQAASAMRSWARSFAYQPMCECYAASAATLGSALSTASAPETGCSKHTTVILAPFPESTATRVARVGRACNTTFLVSTASAPRPTVGRDGTRSEHTGGAGDDVRGCVPAPRPARAWPAVRGQRRTAARNGRREARGGDQIAQLVGTLWQRERTYVADPRRILQTRDTALVVAAQHIAVVRRGADRCWRYAISLLSTDKTTVKEEQ